jgi:hypothetical protein
MSGRLDIGPDVAPVLRPEEETGLRELRAAESLRCAVCGRWIEPGSEDDVSVSVVLDGQTALVRFAHAGCASSRADLAALVTQAEADPLGIAFAQALHPEAGAVLLWERRLDVRVDASGDLQRVPFLDARRADGFHAALADEPVHELPGHVLDVDGDDLVLLRGADVAERFHGGTRRPPPGWMQALGDSGFGLLIAGAAMGLDEPRTGRIQLAIRSELALMGLVAFRGAP